jgi:hypothetical protein
VTKKGPRDSRTEPDSEGSSQNFRVDRVFAPARPVTTPPPTRPSSGTLPQKRPTQPPPVHSTTPPPVVSRTISTQAATTPDSETELSLRRQLSRLQRQLADAQRELANKDEEVAAAVEKRVELQAAYDVLLEEQRQTRLAVDEAISDRARTQGIETRLQDAQAAADELRHQLERERNERAAVVAQLEQITAAFDQARTAWREEASTIDEQHVAQIAQLEQQKKAAVEAAEAAMKTSTERQYQAHEAELEALRAAHERALAALRGDLEPKVSAARDRSAEIERLASELQAQAAEHNNLMAERIDLHKWEMQQQAETHEAELATKERAHAGELARLREEVSAANEAGQLIENNASLREQLWEQTVHTLRESQKKLQQEHADARERAAQAEASKWSVETRLVGTLQALEKANEELREAREKLEVEEAEGRRNALDRQRFAAYLEEGLAMLGALPADNEWDAETPAPRASSSRHVDLRHAQQLHDDEPEHDEPVHDDAPEHDPALEVPQEQSGLRTTRSYAAVEPGLEDELKASLATAQDPADLEPEINASEIDEAEPLPEPTRPGQLRDSQR